MEVLSPRHALTLLLRRRAELGHGVGNGDTKEELASIESALHRLDLGSYGVCESCSKPIAYARLRHLPHVCLCEPCQIWEEQAALGHS